MACDDAFETSPARHNLHGAYPLALYCPLGQGVGSMQVLDPAALILLPGHGSQTVLPYTALKVFTGHIFGVDMPSIPQYEPGSAMEQVVDPVKY